MTKFHYPFLLLLLFACSDANNVRIPYAAVFIKIDTNVQRDRPLAASGSGVFYSTSNRIYADEKMGVGGVYVFHTFNTGYTDRYAAFDTSCPVEASRSVKLVRVGADKMKCNTCGSLFEIGWGYGNSVDGPANKYNYSLQRYRVRMISDTEFQIVN